MKGSRSEGHQLWRCSWAPRPAPAPEPRLQALCSAGRAPHTAHWLERYHRPHTPVHFRIQNVKTTVRDSRGEGAATVIRSPSRSPSAFTKAQRRGFRATFMVNCL